ncbi:allantoinase [Niastella koreensis]|uniref:allantoinase n=2 Tax=Niastella koreensis TaxID=354356 RepID=G8T6J4_NIAKG|nr:allantoinase AllB [Niastella koreensis]AEV96839.1 allantoinase [Niastella koreensis GR20-10]OQP49187.1 allantoinase [Niastella koreensis]
MFDLAISCRNICTPEGMREGTVLVSNGVIVDIVPALTGQVSQREIDIGENVLMPGIIDPHVHINEPGRTDWEGFNTATLSAAAGGITTMVEMPLNASPVTTTADALDKKLAATEGKLHVNCGFWGGIVPGNGPEIEKLINKGVPGFKAFLTHSGIDEFPNVTEQDLHQAMPVIARRQLPLLVHCELTTNVQPPPAADVQSYKNYLSSRPKQWEDDAIALMIRLCEQYQCRVHIVHLSSASSIEQIKQARQKGLPITVETAQHYLYFNAEEIPDAQTAYKCAPPIREKENNEQLWQALQEGIIDFVATDHSPAPPALKEISSGNLIKAWGGIASLQLALPVLWTAARKRKIPVAEIAKWLCEKPAILPGLQKSKGRIAKGFNADFVVWDPDKSFKVTAEALHHKHKITPYIKQDLYGVVEQTWLAGQLIFEQGRFPVLNKGKIITS